ncbi:hypothetical protein CYLTODRAFT_449338 [Cylindrobasidium torrendii FP15055 ss-10]|uniref:Uncharacterized protein n=1 Tax=Cylindrobasidium torrendii FP15055 ss-10 TaxID=1314674 RepID=A0A0D7BSH8_9AGAR|nr:hypothetical protein CYLTODRAFT_449338 [Cylindrobasidium torrendii FP15055 ss-10]
MPVPHTHNLSAHAAPHIFPQLLDPAPPPVAPPRPQMRSVALPDGPGLDIQPNASFRYSFARLSTMDFSAHSLQATSRQLVDMTIFCYDIVAEGETVFVQPSGGRAYVTVNDVLASIWHWLQGTPRMMPPVNPAAQTLPSWALCMEEGPFMASIRRQDILAHRGISLLDGLSLGTSGTSFDMHLI